MTGMRFFHSVDGETAERVDTDLIECSLFGHGICSHSASCSRVATPMLAFKKMLSLKNTLLQLIS